ncbi:hypothetical protein VP01_81g7 [Puccinia sorghi]|uniref:Uncharacterized protein n=1 Tax=Puccinia sorghi TaxID=27349 RepID=A0A0L6UA01_9BASI|nr:hypothetical protein VP01_81g7 [Puccinia sorghi]
MTTTPRKTRSQKGMYLWCSVGCPVKVTSRAGDTAARLCPKCHNTNVYAANRRRWVEICFIPLIPVSNNQIWHCNICNWQANQDESSIQPAAAAFNQPPPGPSQMMTPAQMQMVPPLGYAAPQGPPPHNQQYPGGYGR